jgi:prefoldin subunit 5
MAKKTTKKTVEVPEVNTVETTKDLTNNTEISIEQVMEEAINNIPEEIETITAELENIKPNDDIFETMMNEPEKAEEILNSKLEDLNKLGEMVQKEIQKVVDNNPSIKKKTNFTYMWNGVNLYE